MADAEKKAVEFTTLAEKKLKSSQGFLGSMFGGSNKQEEAADLYIRAANTYKMAKNWSGAGNSFCESAKIHMRLGSKHDAASNYVDASTCYKKADANEAVACLVKAIEIHTDMGRFSQAAKHHVTIAEVNENELSNIDGAIKNYEQAADYYKGEESSSHANKCLLKVAQYSAQLERYDRAIEIYEEIATSCMESSLLKYAAKDHFWRASLCRLAQDLIDAQTAVQRYETMFPAFSDARECKLLKKLMVAMEEGSADSFTEALNEHEQIKRLEPWEVTMLLRAKKTIEGDNELL